MGIDDQPVRKITDLVVYIERNKHPGEWINLTVIRDGQTMSKELVLGERPLP